MILAVIASIFVFILGLVVGSFLNVVIYRLPRDLSVVKPRSCCPGCQTPIEWNQNIPVISYLILRGKCRKCSSPISWQYPVVELLTGFLFWASWRGLGFDAFAIISQIRIWTFISICISIAFIDLEHRIIPDELSLGGWLFGALTCYWDFRNGMGNLIFSSLGGFGFFFLFAIVYEKITGRNGLGGGDIKFMGTIGIFLGFGGIWSSLILSSVIGVIVGVIYAWFQKKRKENILRTAIPYGPFLVMGALAELFFEFSKWLNL